jgi:predicted transcriptional regulator
LVTGLLGRVEKEKERKNYEDTRKVLVYHSSPQQKLVGTSSSTLFNLFSNFILLHHNQTELHFTSEK